MRFALQYRVAARQSLHKRQVMQMLCVLGAIILCSCRVGESASLRRLRHRSTRMAASFQELGRMRKSSPPAPSSHGLMRRFACFGGCCGCRTFQQLDVGRGRVEIQNQYDGTKWWPMAPRARSLVWLIHDVIPLKWTFWKRNGILVFGIPASEPGTYYFAQKRFGANIRLSAAGPSPIIDPGIEDPRYFRIIASGLDDKEVLEHVSSGEDPARFVGSNSEQELELVVRREASSWNFIIE